MYKIQVKKGTEHLDLDLFPNGSFPYQSQVIDPAAKNNTNIPFSVPTEVPYTTTNISIFDNYSFDTALTEISEKGYETRVLNDEGVIVMEGIMLIDSIVQNVDTPHYVMKFNDNAAKFLGELSRSTIHEILEGTSADNNVQFNGTFLQDYLSNDIEMPYIDMCNDTGVEDENAVSRQYIQHGTKEESAGFIPAFKAKFLIEQCFSSLGYNVTSKLFQINDSSGETTINTEDLYYMFDAQITGNDSSRFFKIVPQAISKFKNIDSSSGEPDQNEGTLWNTGSNYSTSEANAPSHFDANKVNVDRGLYHEKGVTNWNVYGSGSRSAGYIAATAGFESEARLSGLNNGATPTGDFKIDIPYVTYQGDNNFGAVSSNDYNWMVRSFDISQSSGTLEMDNVVFEDGYEVARIPLRGEDGTVLSWNLSDCTTHSMNESHRAKDYLVVEKLKLNNNGELVPEDDPYFPDTRLGFTSKDFVPQTEEIDLVVKSGNKYQCRLEVRLVEPKLMCTFNSAVLGKDISAPTGTGLIGNKTWYHDADHQIYVNGSSNSRGRTALTEEFPKISLSMSNWNYLEYFGVIIRSKHFGQLDENGRRKVRWNLARVDDNVNIYESTSNITMTCTEFLKDVMDRFRAELYWNPSTQSFVLDSALERKGYLMNYSNPLNANISQNIDTSKQLSIEINNDVPKDIEIRNANSNDWIDEDLAENLKPFGSYEGAAPASLTGDRANIYNSGKLSFEYKSSLINRTICGEELSSTFYEESNFEKLGFTKNKFAKLKDFGFRVAYLSSSDGKRFDIRKHAWNPWALNNRGVTEYHTAISAKLGLVSHESGSDSLAVKPQDNGLAPTGFYSYLASQENVLGNFLPKLNASIGIEDRIISGNEIRSDYFGVESNPDVRLGIINLNGQLIGGNFSGDFSAVSYNKSTFIEQEVDEVLQLESDANRALPSIQTAVSINTLVKGLKDINGGNEWNAMEYLYLHAGDTNTQLKLVNWRNPNEFNATIGGTALDSSIYGWSNGIVDTNNRNEPFGWLDTGFNPKLNRTDSSAPAYDAIIGFGLGKPYTSQGGVTGVWDDGAYTSIRLNRLFPNGWSPEWRDEILINSSKYKFTLNTSLLEETRVRNFAASAVNLETFIWGNGVEASQTDVEAISVNSMPDANMTIFGINEVRASWTPQVITGFVGTMQYNYYVNAPHNEDWNKESYVLFNKCVDDLGARMK